MPHTVLTVDAVAEYLHLTRDQVEWLVDRGEIPCERRRDMVVFRKKDVDAWAAHRILGLPKEDLRDYHKTTSAKFHDLSKEHAIVPELVQEAYIEPALTSRTKPSVIRDMVKLAESTGLVVYADDLLSSLIRREQMGSTALPGGVALLHPQHPEPYMFEDSFLVLGRAIQPLPFGCPSGETTDLFFLVCCQDDRIHLHVLARLCMMCHHTDLLLQLREAEERSAMYSSLIGEEQEVIRGL